MSHLYAAGHILLYHGVFDQLPSGLESRIHNVHPKEFRGQVEWLRDNFQIVTIDQFVDAPDRSGLAVITFDDAYAVLFSDALPWLIKEAIPSTVYLNSGLIEGKLFWRDKIRFVLGNNLENEFVSFCSRESWGSQIRPERFYKDSKKPALNSQLVDKALDAFFLSQGLMGDLKALSEVIARKNDLIDNPLVYYGNHTASHYVLSSLSSGEQETEIGGCQNWLEESGLAMTQTFAAPFGGSDDINGDTLDILDEMGSLGLVMSRKAVNKSELSDRRTKIPILERYMAPPTLEELKELSFQLERE